MTDTLIGSLLHPSSLALAVTLGGFVQAEGSIIMRLHSEHVALPA